MLSNELVAFPLPGALLWGAQKSDPVGEGSHHRSPQKWNVLVKT